MVTLASSSVSQAAKFAFPLLLILWTVSYYFFGLADSPRYKEVVRQFRSKKAAFIDDALDNEVDGAFNGAGIEKVCESRQWIPGLVMSCDPAEGGVGEVRNAQLLCIRLAIEIGAELILPDIIRRSDHDITLTRPKAGGEVRGVALSYLFDQAHLNSVLSKHCPQMKIYQSLNDLYDEPSMLTPIKFQIGQITQELSNGTVLNDAGDFARQFHGFLDEKSPPAKRSYPLRVHLESALYTWPVRADEPDMARNFGRMLRIRQDARRIAAAALYGLTSKYTVTIPSHRGYADGKVVMPKEKDSFTGVHLRVERDVEENTNFPDYPTQAAYYLNHLSQSGSRVGFVASGLDDGGAGGGGADPGAREDLMAFIARAREFNVTVVTKRDVLEEEERAALQKLSWDQRALVDYEVMLRAGGFVGTGASSFAWSLALRRAYAFGGSEVAVGQGEKWLDWDGGVRWKDAYSVLFGGSDRDKVNGMMTTTWP